jgi:light-regulated signal transduction histidine kinase (bacteriophytochrome)
MNAHPNKILLCDQIDLSSCLTIQSYGALIILDESLQIVQYSSNLYKFIGLGEKLLHGMSLQDILNIFKPLNFEVITQAFHSKRIFFAETKAAKELISLSFHKKINLILVEIEKIETNKDLEEGILNIRQFINWQQEIRSCETLTEIAQVSVERIRLIAGFDRVLLYQFNEEYSGTVIAEDKESSLESYLGLRFPATDIPQPVREAYLHEMIRYIPDVNYVPVEMQIDNKINIDLVGIHLRSVAPVHIEYMKNMGIASSTSIAITLNNKLWGIISFHHVTKKFLNLSMRNYLCLMGEILSTQILAINNKAALENKVKLVQTQITLQTLKGTLKQVFIELAKILLNTTRSEGVTLVLEGKFISYGSTPTAPQLSTLLSWMDIEHQAHPYITQILPLEFPSSKLFKDCACGLLSLPLHPGTKSYLWLFKPEVIQQIAWAGDPSAALTFHESRYSPRSSFKAWTETVTDSSELWTEFEIQMANIMHAYLQGFIGA